MLTSEEIGRLNRIARGDDRETAALLRGILNGQYPGRVVWEDVAGTAYTLQPEDNGKILETQNAGATTITVPAGLPEGFNCGIHQAGAGTVTFDVSAVTCVSTGSLLSISAQGIMVQLVSKSANVFRLFGSLQ